MIHFERGGEVHKMDYSDWSEVPTDRCRLWAFGITSDGNGHHQILGINLINSFASISSALKVPTDRRRL